MTADPGVNWAEASLEKDEGGGSAPCDAPGGKGAPGGADRGSPNVGGSSIPAPDKTELPNQIYAVNKLCGLLSPNMTRQPEPYYTSSEIHSYGPDMLESWNRMDGKKS